MESVKLEFKSRKQKRVVCTVLSMFFWLPALVIQLYSDQTYLLGIRADIVALALQTVGFIFILLSLKYSKCPSCNENAGNGWNVTECNKCGVKFT
jgi:hypothetical protein